MPSYSCLLLDLDGQSSTNLISPGGAFTLVQPVRRAASYPKCFDIASFHYSRSPLYRRFFMSLVTLLCIYNQHARSGSTVYTFCLCLTAVHFSVVFCFSGYDVVASGTGVGGSSFGLLVYCAKVTIFFASFLASIIVSAAFFASAYVLSSTYLSSMSSAGSNVSS
jgi:hypothetical protein